MTKVALVIIDPQRDFHEGGSLGVGGAKEDAARVAAILGEHGGEISSVHVTLDTHHRTHIAHGLFWTNADGEEPAPFTLITADDVKGGTWTPKDAALLEHAVDYCEKLEAAGRFTLCIWPEHCIIGSVGHTVEPSIYEAISGWISATKKRVNYVMKGMNTLTEMYSALKADVPVEGDPGTAMNEAFVEDLAGHDRILFCGQAMSHCVNFTVRDLVEARPDLAPRICVLRDGASAVTGFEDQAAQFLADMEAKGVRVCACAEAFR